MSAHYETAHRFERPLIRARKEAPRCIVGHWTAGEGSPSRVVEALRQRGLSVHYIIGAAGEVWECADPARDVTFHAGHANEHSIGVEIVSAGLWTADHKSQRRIIDDVAVRGVKLKQLAYHPAQLEAWVELCEQLASYYGIARRVPAQLATMTASQILEFEGACEHLHVSRAKVDAGGQLVAALRAHGWEDEP